MKQTQDLFSGLIFPFILFVLLIGKNCFAEIEFVIPLSSADEVTVEHFPSSGKYLMLWLAPEYGLRPSHRTIAKILNKNDIEVWQIDLLQSLFLPQTSGSIKKLSGKHVADIIEYAHKTSHKKIILVGGSYSAITVLRGAHQWQQRKIKESYLIGAILFSPSTYLNIPPLGQTAEYMPIITATNIPIMIYQAKNNSNIGQFEHLTKNLQQHDNVVYAHIVPDIISLFYKEKPNKKNQQQIKLIARNIKKMIPVLEKHSVPSTPIKLTQRRTKKRGIDTYLKEYKGDISPLPINLKDAYGNTFIKNNFKGKVTIINFWATWCPPCVKEIPSLNSLKKKMQGQPFELISINYAEDEKTITEFMKKIKVEFPVLLDKNGSTAKNWNVIAYPSTFVIDKRGEIKYGVNAAIEWDSDKLIKKIQALF